MQVENLKLKLILPMIVILMVSAIVSISVLFYSLSQEQNYNLKKTLRHQQILFNLQSQEKLNVMEDMVQFLLEKNGVQNALKTKDKEALLELSMPIYHFLKKQNITHLYFISTDKKAILRAHNITRFGDTIDRFSLKKALLSGLPQKTIEIGVESNFVLRYTYPVKKDRKVIGYIEVGQDIEKALTEISKNSESYITILVPRKSIDLNTYSVDKQSKDSKKYKFIGDYAVSSSTLPDIGTIQASFLSQKNPMIMSSRLNDEFFHFRKDLIDFSGKTIGVIFYSEKISYESKEKLINALIIGSIIMGIVSLIIFIFYCRYIRKIDYIITSQQEELENNALIDPLTGLNNRRYLDMSIQKKMLTAKRCEKISVFFMLDIDHFKFYNDNYGHQKGDEALIKVAELLKNHIKRSTDILVRMGGEEFGFFGIFENETKMINFGEKILKVIQDAKIVHEFNMNHGVITVSIGISVSTCEQNKTFEQLYKEADDALYISKENGRNTLTVYDG